MSTKLILAIVLVSLIANGLLAYLAFGHRDGQQSLGEHYPYLSKRLFAVSQNDIILNFIPLRGTLRDYVAPLGDKVGVYFEYLPSGVSISANGRIETEITSLTKVPVAMAVYKKIEKGELSKTDVLRVAAEHLDEQSGELWKKGEGMRLSVEELLDLSLRESDNTAYNVLVAQLSLREMNEVFDNLDIEYTASENSLLISPSSFSSVFKSLYFSSFLQRQNSNEILEILTKSPFKDKIAAGVPNHIRVAHKIGFFVEPEDAESVYRDCGIVYAPQRPYLLCVFVQGTEQEAKDHISLISKMVYGYVTAVKGG